MVFISKVYEISLHWDEATCISNTLSISALYIFYCPYSITYIIYMEGTNQRDCLQFFLLELTDDPAL
jgi:hypothetical protein